MTDLLLNVTFGILAFMPVGWLFMACIIFLECWLASGYLSHKSINRRVCLAILAGNLTSGILGILTTLTFTGGWIIVVWFPWVSAHEIQLETGNEIFSFALYYIIAFILSVLIEGAVNWILLRKKYRVVQILRCTFWTNAGSYIFGSFIMYGYSFNVLQVFD